MFFEASPVQGEVARNARRKGCDIQSEGGILMSFADEVREELCELPVKKNCCRQVLTAGLLLGAEMRTGKEIAVRYRHETVATMASSMIRQQYGKSPDSLMTGACGHRYYDLSFVSPAVHKLLCQITQNSAEVSSVLHFSCEACQSAFLRGAFLAWGTVNDPHKSFHLEFLLPNEERASFFARFLDEVGYPARTIKRARGVGVYVKDGGSVEDLVGMMGAQHTVFEIINSRIECDIRNNENRATNCVAKNIEKTISAATRQMEAINRLMETGHLDALPEPLRQTAMLRYRHPDATLDELTRLHEPPISKSGLNHRLKKLLDEADDL